MDDDMMTLIYSTEADGDLWRLAFARAAQDGRPFLDHVKTAAEELAVFERWRCGRAIDGLVATVTGANDKATVTFSAGQVGGVS